MKKLICIFLVLGCGSVQAATVTYSFEFRTRLGFTDNGDVYNLVDAKASYIYRFDDTKEWDSNTVNPVFYADSAEIRFTERQNGAENTSIAIDNPSLQRGSTANSGNLGYSTVYHFSGQSFTGVVTEGTEFGMVTNNASDLGTVMNTYAINDGCFMNNILCYYPHLPRPDHPDFESDLTPLNPPAISFVETAYEFDYLGYSVSIVPIPAAVYLFASGLGLLGWFRRKA
jgi:hypothetical protein